MDRSKDGRRSTVESLAAAASNGLLRRRKRSASLRDSPEEGGLGNRDRGSRRREKRGGEPLKKKRRRRRGNKQAEVAVIREEGDETAEESVSDVEQQRKSSNGLPPHRFAKRQVVMALKVAHEMISVSVPRKARSASVQRPHESWVSSNAGFGEDRNHRRLLNASARKKAKSSGPKTQSLSSVHEDIEFEIAEVLYGLKKLTRGSKNDENTENVAENIESDDKIDATARDSKSLPASNSAQISVLAQVNSVESDPLLGVVLKKQNLGVDSTQDQIGRPAEMVFPSPELERTTGLIKQVCEVSPEMDICKIASRSPEWQEDSKLEMDKSKVADVNKSSSSKVEDSPCTKFDAYFQDSVSTKVNAIVLESERPREKNIKIDLMAHPSMMMSPEQDGFVNLSSNPKSIAKDLEVKMGNAVESQEIVEISVKKEVPVAQLKEQKVKSIVEKSELEVDLEKPKRESCNDHYCNSQKKQQPTATISKLETSAQSIAVPNWPSGLQAHGYMSSFPTVLPIDGTVRSSTALQAPRFLVSQSRPKRCATHHYIACNIRLHQQCMKMNHSWPTGAGSTALCGGKANNLNALPSTDTTIFGSSLRRSLPLINLSTAQEKGHDVVNYPDLARKDGNSDAVNIIDMAQKKQVILHPSPEPCPTDNLPHGPTFIFSLGQQHVAGTANQAGPSKSPALTGNGLSSGNSIPGTVTAASALPAVATALCFNYPNLAPNGSPFMTIIPKNGCPFPVSTPIGNPSASRGVDCAQALPLYAASFYPPQVLHPFQVQQQQHHPQLHVQAVPQNATTQNVSSSFHKPPQREQSEGAQFGSKNFITSVGVHSQQQLKHHLPSQESQKLENNKSGVSIPRITNSRGFDSQVSVHGQSFIIPLRPNYPLIPCTSGDCNHTERKQQQQSQEQALKRGVELIHSPAYAVSFASFSGNNTTSDLNFSPMGQNLSILQGTSDRTQQEYQAFSTTTQTHKNNHQLSEGKTGCSSTSTDDRKNASLGKSSSAAQTLVFNNSARTLNFVSFPSTGNWPSLTVNSMANAPVADDSPNSQKQQLPQLQKQQQPQHPIDKAASNNLSPSCTGPIFSLNTNNFSQTLAQSNISTQNRQWKNSSGALIPQAATLFMASNNSTLHSVSQPQGTAPQGHNQISVGGYSRSTLASQGQQLTPNSQSSSVLVVDGQPNGGNLRTTSVSTKAKLSVHALQSQPSDNPGSAPNSSSLCGRTVPSILSNCPSHLSELKY